MGLMDALVNHRRKEKDHHYRQGQELCRNGYYLDALDELDRMLATDPFHAGSWFLKGYALYQAGRYDEALQSLDRALDLDPALHEALTYKGLIHSGSGRHTEALVLYDRALELDPESTKSWYVRGLTLAILERYEEAIRSYEHALSLDPKHVDALTGISIAMKRLEKGRTGARCPGQPAYAARTEVSVAPPAPSEPAPSPAFRPLLATTSPGNTIQSAKPPLVIPPGGSPPAPSVSLRNVLGQRQAHPDQNGDEIPQTSRAFPGGLFPEREPPRRDRTPRRSHYDEEIDRLTGIVAHDPLDGTSWCSLGDLYMRIGNYPGATEAYDHALDCNEEDGRVWAALGDARRKTGAYDEALFAFERSLEISPDPAVWVSHARVLVTTGSLENAVASCDSAIALDETHVDAWLYKGFILRKIRRHDEAISAYDQVLALQPGHDQALRQRKSLIDGG